MVQIELEVSRDRGNGGDEGRGLKTKTKTQVQYNAAMVSSIEHVKDETRQRCCRSNIYCKVAQVALQLPEQTNP